MAGVFFQNVVDTEPHWIRSAAFPRFVAKLRASRRTSRDRSRSASTVPTTSTVSAITTCSGMGSSGWFGLMCSTDSSARATAQVVIHKLCQPAYVFHCYRDRRSHYSTQDRRISYTLAAIVAAPKAHKPTTMLSKGNFQILKNNIHGRRLSSRSGTSSRNHVPSGIRGLAAAFLRRRHRHQRV